MGRGKLRGRSGLRGGFKVGNSCWITTAEMSSVLFRGDREVLMALKARGA